MTTSPYNIKTLEHALRVIIEKKAPHKCEEMNSLLVHYFKIMEREAFPRLLEDELKKLAANYSKFSEFKETNRKEKLKTYNWKKDQNFLEKSLFISNSYFVLDILKEYFIAQPHREKIKKLLKQNLKRVRKKNRKKNSLYFKSYQHARIRGTKKHFKTPTSKVLCGKR